MKQKILVIGGTGMLGKPVAMKLKEKGFQIIIFTRNASEARIKMPTSFEFCEGDVNDIVSLQNAMEGCYGVHVNLQGGPKFDAMERTEHLGMVNIVDAARISGIKKITHITGSSVKMENTWFRPTRAKYNAEEYLKKSGINYTIFRPSWFFESLPLFIRNNKATIIGENSNPFHWVAADDYAKLVAESYEKPETNNKTLFVYGPEKMTMANAITKYVSLTNPEVKISKVPLGMLNLISTITFNPELKYVSKLSAYFSKINPENGEAQETEQLLGKSKTNLEDWVTHSN
ncbi:MAG: NAD(P)H-binding protein [Bacteroidales bacterium]|nr:NAD(P)H-binding protein [Bacteroidales bacterium]MBN2818087.1 NAD(P)H-binding protein [Bacteroidales bacterium]